MIDNKDLLISAIQILPYFCKFIEPYANRSNLTAKSALLLLVLFEAPENFDFFANGNEDDIDFLIKGGYLNVGERYSLTGKGAIISKSFVNLKGKFYSEYCEK